MSDAMKFRYRVVERSGIFTAECVESTAAGEGPTPHDAIEALRMALRERMFRPDAIAPPPMPTVTVIELEPYLDACDGPRGRR